MTSSYPIDEILPALKTAVMENRSIVLQAPPGAGKTTRVPLAMLDIIPAGKGRLVMLEPRRIAAVAAARWMAHLLGEEVGRTVGYSIRFDSKISGDTRIEVVTEGILTRRIQADPSLAGVAMVLFDEFHERSLQADLALALCLDVRKNLREDLKILVMSATLESAPLATLLGDAPVIASLGRIFPVQERYQDENRNRFPAEQAAATVATALNETSGDILVFLPGAGEIRACAEALRPVVERAKDLTLHPLYGDLPFEEQERAILPGPVRKIVLATNIAETSLTIEGVRVVIDSGLTRRLQYDPATGLNRLITVTASKASAEQRKGRAGRLEPGICYRLYSRHVFQSMIPFAPPEILISDLSALVLDLAAWGVKAASELAWLDAPPKPAWDAAGELLQDLGALDASGSITSRGKAMVRLPLQPRLARLLLRAGELGCSQLGVDLAALLSERDILRRNPEAMMPEPDIEERLDTLRGWRKGRGAGIGVDPWALRSVERTAQQLWRLMPPTHQNRAPEANHSDLIPRLLLAAFPDRIARRRDDRESSFVLVQGRAVRFTSVNPLSQSPFIVAVQMDAGAKSDGIVHIAAALTEEMIREECGRRIKTVRRIEWDRRENRITAVLEERLGAVLLSAKPFTATDEESGPILCNLIRTTPDVLTFSDKAGQFQGRVSLMAGTFPEESWPDLSTESLLSAPEHWLSPYLAGIRTAPGLAGLDLLPALRARLTWEQLRLLDERAPTHLTVPSGHRIALDYASGNLPVLAVKLQELFGLADTPLIAGDRVKVLLHLLSPARRPVQITRDLKGFWDNGYPQVKKELKGRYPKHPWPDDPWNAVPTRRTKARP
jgi:ATP-dependent helicase HrpB